ncbi:leucyl aminopeptidase family protein [Micromonospora sp. Llam7]|uniref:leucyl aminopeptidase family protein n=1 Tax=Micromonospora tarapacensis TaxID=2835305 RepID=UPI001C83FC07|nr:leucyl aminopeptidase family protein [Micromonospora tarapacensis]
MLAIRLTAEPDRLDTVALPVRPGAVDDTPAEPMPTAVTLPDGVADEAAALIPMARFAGRAGEVHVQLRPARTPAQSLLVGVGEADEAGWRAAGAALVRAARNEIQITVMLPVGVSTEAVRGLVEGLLLGSYRFRLGDDSDAPALTGVDLAVTAPETYEQAVEVARTTARMTRLARDLTNMPSSVKNPQWFAGQVAEAVAELPGLGLRVREPEQLAAEGFGGILAVGGGSASGPRLVELDWHPADAGTHVVLVGKGITFDTGGISIKPVPAMKLMRKDMAGAAAVVAATLGAAALRLPVRITTLAPLAENMVSGAAFRPGDIVRHYGGLTSETTNSDAEGRLVLADALAYAEQELKPDLLIDLATLTGANAVALGTRTGALYSDNDQLATALLAAIEAAGEAAWRMPLAADYVEHLGSDLADLHSAPTQGAGSVLAALYLREFTGDLRDRWLHIDMSAPSWCERDDAELTRGATGWGVRGLLRWLASLS